MLTHTFALVTSIFYYFIVVFGWICALQPLQRTAATQVNTVSVHMNVVTDSVKLLSLETAMEGPQRNLLPFS